MLHCFCFRRVARANPPFSARWLAALVLLATAGCGGPARPELAPVKGEVLFRGQPLVGATVVFIRPGAARHSFGVTDARGAFTLSTYEPDDGALLGENGVQVIPASNFTPAATGEVPTPEEYYQNLEGAAKSPHSDVPERYGNVATSGLNVIVVAGENHPRIELSD